MSSMMAEHKEAPVAIWLGLLMDGIPEAYAKGGSIVELSTLGGFLAIIIIKS